MSPAELLHTLECLARWAGQLLGPLMAMTWQEICGAALGVLGTALLAFNGRWAGWGFVAYLGSNAAWFWFALDHAHPGLLLQQVVFTFFSLVGIWKWLVAPVGEWLDNVIDWGDPT